LTGQTLGLQLKSATYHRLLQNGFPFEVALQARPGSESVRIVVVDENSGRMGTLTIPASSLMTKR
jgi:hypothetical protein